MNLSEYDFSVLVPPKEVFEVQHNGIYSFSARANRIDYYIKHGEGPKAVRKIFSDVPYSPFELKKLEEFEGMIQRKGLLLPSW